MLVTIASVVNINPEMLAAFARALREAVSIDPDQEGVPSTKGTLTG